MKKNGAGFVYYLWPLPGAPKDAAPVQKVSYVKGFDAWGWVIGSGIYLDDVAAAFRRQAIQFGLVALVVALLTGSASFVIARNISGAVGRMTGAMRRLADGDTSIQISGTDRSDEIAHMARAVQVFRDNAVRMEHMTVEQEEAKRRTDEEKHAHIMNLAKDFENKVTSVAGLVKRNAERIVTTAGQVGSRVGTSASRSLASPRPPPGHSATSARFQMPPMSYTGRWPRPTGTSENRRRSPIRP